MRKLFIFVLLLIFLFLPESVVPSTNDRNVSWINQPLAKGVFLVASPDLIGPYFNKSVVLLAEYNHEGALGVIINRPSYISLSKALPDFKGLDKNSGTLFIGGPVSQYLPFMLIRTDNAGRNRRHIFDNVFYSMNVEEIIYNILNKNSKSAVRVYAGFSSWAPGQLEAEVARGSWRIIKADTYTVFDKNSETIWDDLIRGESQIFIKKFGGKFYFSMRQD